MEITLSSPTGSTLYRPDAVMKPVTLADLPLSSGFDFRPSITTIEPKLCQRAATGCFTGEPGLLRRCRAQRCSLLVVRGRLLELRWRARPRLPSTT
eukprot:scaffold107507_cov69-Phaeocystis_antarctica.AAC.6